MKSMALRMQSDDIVRLDDFFAGGEAEHEEHHDQIRMDDFASDVVELDEEKFAKEYKWPKIIINTNVTESKSMIFVP